MAPAPAVLRQGLWDVFRVVRDPEQLVLRDGGPTVLHFPTPLPLELRVEYISLLT